MNYDSENIFDDEYKARKRREMIPDGGSVRVPLTLLDSAPGRADNRGAAVKARDEAHRLMCDRMTRPKDFDPITGKRLVNDELDVSSLTEEEVFALAQRLAPAMGVAVPNDYLAGGANRPGLASSRPATEAAPPPHGDNRWPHYKQARDAATGIRLRDESYRQMVSRMTGGRR